MLHKNEINKKGFTFIELMVAVVIIGILLSFGTIRHTNQKETLRIIGIRNDVMMVESVIKEKLVLDSAQFNFWGRETTETMNAYREANIIYDRNGRVKDELKIADYRHIPDDFVKEEVLIERTGYFFMNEEGVVYYVDDATIELPPPTTKDSDVQGGVHEREHNKKNTSIYFD